MKKLQRVLQVLLAVVLVAVGVQNVAATSVAESSYYPLYKMSTYEYWQASYMSPGSVLVVKPGYQFWGLAARYSSAERMVKNNQVRTIVLAGVGSSSRGTAAMAKLIANALNEPVAGIVTGWGDYSTAFEGSQGFFVGRTYNTLGSYYYDTASSKLDSLYRGGARPYRVIGHSKGSFDAANTFYKMNNEGRAYMYSQTTFISFGLGLHVPGGLANVRNYLGSADPLGQTNTTTTQYVSWVWGKGHSLNPVMPIHVSVSGRLNR